MCEFDKNVKDGEFNSQVLVNVGVTNKSGCFYNDSKNFVPEYWDPLKMNF